MRLRRPSLLELSIFILGVGLIGVGAFQLFCKVSDGNGVLVESLSEPLIPTPKSLNSLNQNSQDVLDGSSRANPESGIQVLASPEDYRNQTSPPGHASLLGSEPLTSDLLEQIHAAGKEYPVWIRIPSIQLSTPVVPAILRKVIMDGKLVDMWFAPDFEAAGWHTSSALPGEPGNLVFSGHNNDNGQVFANLDKLHPGDLIELVTQKMVRKYMVTNIVLFQEVEVGLTQRQDNARWISPTDDERITLVTCWPRDSNTHRLIIVAAPQ